MKDKTTEVHFLDKNSRLCFQKEAQLQGEVHALPNNAFLQKIRAYNPDVAEASKMEENSRPAQPIGRSDNPIKLGHKTLQYSQEGMWINETATLLLEIHPDSDQKDTIELLKALKPIEEKILARGLAGGKLRIQIGTEQPEPEKPRLADSRADTHTIRAQTCSHSKRLISVCAWLGTQKQISLEGILLHEIGHILAPQLNSEKNRLGRSLERHIDEAVIATKKISPHFLGKQIEKIKENLSVIQDMEDKGKKTVKVDGIRWETFLYRSHLIQNFQEELFAEMLREFYLEPVLHGVKKEKQKTGWPELEHLKTILTREAKYSLKTKGYQTEVFPQKRREPSLQNLIGDILP